MSPQWHGEKINYFGIINIRKHGHFNPGREAYHNVYESPLYLKGLIDEIAVQDEPDFFSKLK